MRELTEHEEKALRLLDVYEKTPQSARAALLTSWSPTLEVLVELSRHRGRNHRLKAWAHKQAFAQARTLADYVMLAHNSGGGTAQRHAAEEAILEFDITSDEDIEILKKGPNHLPFLARYLERRKRDKKR